MSTTAQPLPSRRSPAWGAGRVVTLVCGSLFALLALGLVTAGIVLVLAQRAPQRNISRLHLGKGRSSNQLTGRHFALS